MIYLIDGYNFTFRLFHNEKSLELQRQMVIDFLKNSNLVLHLNIHIIFDAYKQERQTPNIAKYDHLKVIYTSKDQTADEYILEQIFLSKNPSNLTIVTCDNNIRKHAKLLNANSMSIEDFFDWIIEKEEKIKEKAKEKNLDIYVDTDYEIKRLQKIFEKKLKDLNQ